MVPEDELILFQGQQVCAEGKAILLDRLKAGDALTGGMERPSFWRRLGCFMLDGIILGLPMQIGRIALFGLAAPPVLPPSQLLYTLFTQLVFFVYFGQFHAISGQSLGKKAGKIIVVNEDGTRITTKTAYIRALAYMGVNILATLAAVIGGRSAYVIMLAVSSLWLLAEVICLLVDREGQRSLHDRIAGTRVVLKG